MKPRSGEQAHPMAAAPFIKEADAAKRVLGRGGDRALRAGRRVSMYLARFSYDVLPVNPLRKA